MLTSITTESSCHLWKYNRNWRRGVKWWNLTDSMMKCWTCGCSGPQRKSGHRLYTIVGSWGKGCKWVLQTVHRLYRIVVGPWGRGVTMYCQVTSDGHAWYLCMYSDQIICYWLILNLFPWKNLLPCTRLKALRHMHEGWIEISQGVLWSLMWHGRGSLLFLWVSTYSSSHFHS